MADFEPDVGVLIVHGIGTQSEGSELRQWVDSVLSYLDAFPDASDSADDPRILQPNSANDKLVRLLTPPLGDANSSRRQKWLIGEAWWAEAFEVPDRKEVSRWLVDVGPWFVYMFVVRLWRRFHVDRLHVGAGLAFAGSVAWLLHGATGAGLGPASWWPAAVAALAVFLSAFFHPKGRRLGALVVAMTLLLGYPLAALGTVGILLLWLVGLLPGKVSTKARALQLALARSVGDVYALISSPRREQAMFDALSGAADTLVAGPEMAGKPVVLVAHSMGAALTYRAFNHDAGLRRALGERDVTLVTYGEAILPVHLFEQRLRETRPVERRVQALAGLVGLVLFAFSLARLASDAIDGWAQAAALASMVLVIPSFVATWHEERRVRSGSDEVRIAAAESGGTQVVSVKLRPPGAAPLRWVDLWAPWDPVPNGPLSVTYPCGKRPCGYGSLPAPGRRSTFLSCRVANVHQPWRDHVVYRKNYEDVVSRWVGEIAVRANPAVAPTWTERPKLKGTAEVARQWRLRRGVALFLGQAVAAAAGMVTVSWHWDELDDLGRRVARYVPLRSAVESIVDVVPHGIRDGVFGNRRDSSHLQGLVVAVAALAVLIALASAVVSWWQSTATRRYLAGEPDTAVKAAAGMWASIAAATTMVLLLVGLNVRPLEDAPVRTLQVHPAEIIAADDSTATSTHTEVRFEPVDIADDSPVVVELDDEAVPVELDAKLSYRLIATAAGGKDCSVSFRPDQKPTDVRVSCPAVAPVLPPSEP